MIRLDFCQYFPIDYFLIATVILYMFWATSKGIISIGIRVLWVNLYRFRRAATQPQGLLAATMLLTLSLVGLCYSMTMSIAPEYSMFGHQEYVLCRRGFGVDPLDGADDEDLDEPKARGLLSEGLDTEDGLRQARRRELMTPDAEIPKAEQGYG
ncbi:hypothetical protein BGZ65_000599 [Modicella reniformis]|uniref:Uncharacterized protein n=1 Tax=Modicella reniformis TaxID=1440133 RepID=A0A9P6SQA4_9FUNG|nr:hypothetical protein BGZ65_000599 [Modicella reniformis]